MAAGRVAHRAAALPWLAPSAQRLTAWAEGRKTPSDDPASVLLLLRFSRPTPTLDDLSFDSNSFQQSAILEAAAVYLESGVEAWPDPRQPEIARILQFSKLISDKAESLAAVSGTCPPAAARAAGLLAPLGWLAVAAIEPDALMTCRLHEQFPDRPAVTEELVFGLSTEAIARRLALRWKLPTWLAGTIGTLRLPVADAVKLGADPGLTRVLRLAIASIESRGNYYGLLGTPALEQERDEFDSLQNCEVSCDEARDPRSVPLLASLMTMAANLVRSVGTGRIAGLERQIDALQSLLQQVRAEFDDRLRDAKLEALAELAAGAGHEINNPLAVISGNAQLLRSGEEEPERRRALDTIVRQASRVADLLQDLMQFARPPAATPAPLLLADLLAAVERDANPIAAMKGVTLRVAGGGNQRFCADAAQMKKALGNLVRNAIDFTPTGGIVRVYQRPRQDRIELVVEDAGPGPDADAVPHLFDPFYSGRSAGRGRGLGLPTAWRFARQNGGDVRFERSADGPTRFILCLPLADAAALLERQSA